MSSPAARARGGRRSSQRRAGRTNRRSSGRGVARARRGRGSSGMKSHLLREMVPRLPPAAFVSESSEVRLTSVGLPPCEVLRLDRTYTHGSRLDFNNSRRVGEGIERGMTSSAVSAAARWLQIVAAAASRSSTGPALLRALTHLLLRGHRARRTFVGGFLPSEVLKRHSDGRASAPCLFL